jgi:glycine/D-amino acid oxidase-like deaminating enzyme
VGPVVADPAFRTAFARLAHGPVAARWPDAPVIPGLLVSLAHGSRGTCTAWLAAELLADIACGSPRCVPNDLLPALLPQRFLVRELRGARAG